MPRIIIYSFSFFKGGAAIAASKFNLLCIEYLNFTSVQQVAQDNAGLFQFFKRLISYFLIKLQFDGNPIKHSLNLFSYSPVLQSFKLNKKSIHHLHWINNDTLSIFDLNKIPFGSIITLHDEWFYCGTEHCYNIFEDKLFFEKGYPFFDKKIFGIPWNYIVWKIKFQKIEKRFDLIYTTPSIWLYDRAKSSLILRNSQIFYLPNPIDTGIFKPFGIREVRKFYNELNIEFQDFIFVFGAIKGKKNHLKGMHLLEQSIKIFFSKLPIDKSKRVTFINFGGEKSKGIISGFKNISLGHIKDQKKLALLYSCANCVIVPSMVESFGQVAAEALSCATPVVCFDTSGLKDIVLHNKTGLLANPFDVEALADQMLTIFLMSDYERNILGLEGRNHILANFSFPVVSEKYKLILEKTAKINHNNDDN